ncbi:MAG: FKBP-type peptidyl-prolyl cis-trans isomerase [Chitinophagales bacterium]|nr:FKBP-type peptidyl-prolyl cis-trans isomerase [Chitinophagales bacterium]
MRISIYFAFLLLVGLAACSEGNQVMHTADGYEYILHTPSEGTTPQPGEYVYFHAQMRNGDSIVYGSRSQGAAPFIQIPLTQDVNRKASPVEDVLREMAVGDSATVMINLDTLPQKPRGFEDASTLYYDVVVTDILSQEAYQEKAAAERAEKEQAIAALQERKTAVAESTAESLKAYKAGELGDQLQETESGLKYVVLEEGTGAKATPGNQVKVHYYGVLAEDGTMFDNSFGRGEPFGFGLGEGRVIRGWDEGIALLNVGSKAVLFIPAELGYGANGAPPTIPPGAELAFYVELVGVN